MSAKRKAIFPGSFDPYTKGHHDIILRGSKIFDEVIIGIGKNANKQRYFPLGLMIEKINEACAELDNVHVIQYEGLTGNFAREMEASYLLRGLRNTTDFEYENSISQGNKYVNHSIETVFLITSPNLAYISSSMVRDIHRHGTSVDDFLPFSL